MPTLDGPAPGVRRRPRVVLALAVCLLAAPPPILASAESRELAARAATDLYNLDLDRALAGYRAAVAADPEDTAGRRGLASALWMSIAMARGSVTVDSYLGRISRDEVKLAPPPAPLVQEFRREVDRTIDLARQRLARDGSNPDTHYELGAALGWRASYAVTVEGSVRVAFGAAREAYNEHERVLELDGRRRDAGLIVGTYRYLVASFALPVRWVAYMAGFGGGREKGLQLIEAAAAYEGDNRIEARLALVLIYNREKRYAEALRQLALLREQYPRNRLLWLESGSTALRGGGAADAERFLDQGIARLAADPRPRMFGEDALWYYKRGATRAALGRFADAERDLRRALASEGRKWVHGRSHLELGRLSVKRGRPADAAPELRRALALAESDNDPATATEARRLLE